MAKDNIRPTTLEGVKRLAKQIKKERSIKHAEALELAAKQVGYESYRLAQALMR